MSKIDVDSRGITQMDETDLKSQDDVAGESVMPLNDCVVNSSNNGDESDQNNNNEDIEMNSAEQTRKRPRESEEMCANDEAPASKSQPVPGEAESAGSVSETHRCRRYKPLFPLHFELDADSATVYIDGGLAARVCSVVKNSLDEIRGAKRVVAQNSPSATTTLPSNKKSTKQAKETKRTDSATPPAAKRSKLSTSTENKQDEKRKRPSSVDGSTRSGSVASCSSSVDYNNSNLPASGKLSSSSRRQSSSKSSLAQDVVVDTIDTKSEVKEIVKESSAVKQETPQNDEQKSVDKHGAKKLLTRKYRSEEVRMRAEGKGVVESGDVDEIPEQVSESQQLQHASIAGLNDEEILKMFGMEMQLNVVLERLSESSIEVLKEKIRSEARERATSRESVTEKKKRKTGRVRVGSSSSTESERENAPSVLEQLGKKQKEKKRHKPKGTDRTCTTCRISLCDCVDAWLEVLGPRSTYCSMECVEKQVEKAKAVIEDQSARVMLLDRSGTMLNGPSAPKLVDLLQFLREHPEFAPVLPSSQLSPKKSQQHFQTGSSKGGDSENKQQQQQQRNVSANKSEKLISKENDQRRLQVRRAICEKLLVRAKKTADLAFTQQELKALSQRIEEELFRQCRHSVSGKYRSWFRQFLICVTDETNKGFYLRTILGEISVPKLVSLDATELGAEKLAAEMEIPIASRRSTAAKKATASSSLNGGGGDVKTTNAGVDEHSSETGKIDGDSKEADATTTALHDENDMVDEGEAVNPFPEKSPPPASGADGAKSSGSGMKPVVKAESEVDKILGLGPMNTTAQHRFHLFDMNCDICTGKRDRELAQRKQKREKRDRRASRSGNTVVVGGGGADVTAASPSKTTAPMQLLSTVPVAKTPQKPADRSEEILVKRVDTDVGSSNKSKTTSVRGLTESDSWRDSGGVEPKKGSPRASSTDADDGWMGPEDDYDIVDEIDDTDDLDGGGVSMGNDESVDERGRNMAIGGRNSASASGAGFDMDEDDEKPLGWKQSSRARDCAERTVRRSRRGDGADSPNEPISESWRSLNFAKRKEDVEKKRKKDIIASDEVGRTSSSSRLNTDLIGESWRQSCLTQQQNATSGVSCESWRGTTSIVESHLNLIRTKDDEKRTAHNIRPLLEPFLSRRSLVDADNDSSNNNSTDSGSYGKGYDKNMGKGQRVSSNAERWKKTKQRMEKSPNKKKNVMEPVDEQFDAPSIWDLEADHAVWHGMITMGQFLQFQTSFTALSNERAFRLREEFPSTLRIIGRIPPQVVVDYLANLKKTRTKDVIILNMDSPVLPEINTQFLKCFMDMRRKNRYSVLALDEQPTLKDGYLIALASGEQPPAVLLPYDGPGIADNHPDMIICVIVRHRDTAAAAARAQMAHQQQLQQEQVYKPTKSVSTGEVSKNDDPLRDIDIKPTIEIPLERRNRSPSPSTIMREFEYSMEERQQLGDSSNSPPPFMGNISPTMVHVRPSTSSFVDSFGTDQEHDEDRERSQKVESRNNGGQGKSTAMPHFFGSPPANDQLWSGMLGSEEDSELTRRKSSVGAENETNSLLPPGFFDRIQKSTAVKAPMPMITSIADLLVAIHTHTQPSEIAFLVADFTAKNVLGAEEQKLIENAIKKKVLVERKKRGDIIEEIDENKNTKSKKFPSSSMKQQADSGGNEEDLFTASDFETGSKPSTFVGDVNAEKLKQMNIQLEGLDAFESNTPMSPDEPQIPLPPLDLNTSAPPPPLPPPPPPPVASTIPLIPPVPPPIIPSNTDAMSFAIPPPFPPPPMAPASFMAPPNVPTMASVASSSSNAGTNGRKTRLSESNTAGSGEMDMDISDDDEHEQKSEGNSLLPPPPPPPAFHVPVPQPPPVPNIPLLPIPSVPTPPSPVIAVQRNEKGPYFGMNAPPPIQNIQVAATSAGMMQPSYRGVSPKTIPVISSTSKTLPSLSSNVLAPPQFPLMDPSVPPPSVGSSLSMNIVNPAATTGGGHLSISGQTNPQSIAGMSYNIRANLADEIRTREPPEEDSGSHRLWNETASSSWSLGKSSSTEMGGRDSAVIDVNQPSTSSKYHPQDSRSTSMATAGVQPDQSQSSPVQCRLRPAFNVEQYFDEADECLGSSAPNYSPHKEKASLLPTPRQQQQSQQSHSSSTPLSLYQTPVRDRDDRAPTFSHFQLSAERTSGYSGSQHSPINQQQQQRSMQQQPQHQSLASATLTAAIRTPLLSSHQYEPAAVDVNRVLYGSGEDVRNLPKWSDEANMSSANQARHTASSTFLSQTLADNNDRFYQQATAMTTNRPPSYSSFEQTIYSEPPPLAAHLSSRHGQASSAAGYACSSSLMSSPPPAIRLSNAPGFKQNIMGLSHSAPKSHRPPSPLTASAHHLSGGNVTPLGNRGRPNSGRGGGAAAGGNNAFSQQHRALPQSSSRGGRGSVSGRGSIFEQSRKFFW